MSHIIVCLPLKVIGRSEGDQDHVTFMSMQPLPHPPTAIHGNRVRRVVIHNVLVVHSMIHTVLVVHNMIHTVHVLILVKYLDEQCPRNHEHVHFYDVDSRSDDE